MKTSFSLWFLVLVGFVCLSQSCVREDMPPDCIKPEKPKVNANISVKGGNSFQLHAEGQNNAKYYWSGPHGFYSDSASPTVNNANINNNGDYWVKARIGYCYSDSVSTHVAVQTDSTCNLGNNIAGFANGSAGLFGLTSISKNLSNGNYQILAVNSDSSLLFEILLKQKPVKSGALTLTDAQNPGSDQIYFHVKTIQGGSFFAPTNTCYIIVKGSKINIVLCFCPFQNLGILCANIAVG